MSRAESLKKYHGSKKFRETLAKYRATQKYANKRRAQRWRREKMPVPTRPEPDACECCGRTERRALNLDHDHVTGEFRGWLCTRCNTGIGLLGDSFAGLKCAIAYFNKGLL